MSTFTAAKDLELVARGDDVGTWDTPTNSNWSIVDAALGGKASITLGAANVTLTTSQFQQAMITFGSTLTANVAITFPSSFTGFYTIQNACTGSSAFTISLKTTVAGSQLIMCPPMEPFDILNDGSNIKFKNFGRIGQYWDYCGSSVPAWVLGCSVPPYLYCDGSAFSAAIYPTLASILGSTTLPDARGRFRASLNDGTGRITSGSSTGGLDGNTLAAAGGSQTTTLSSDNLPPVPITDPGHHHAVALSGGAAVSGAPAVPSLDTAATQTTSAFTGISAGSTSPTNFSRIPPTYIGGITLVRAA